MRHPLSVIRMTTAASVASVALLPMTFFVSASHAQADKITVSERTEVKVILIADLKSGSTREGSEIPFEVERDVTTSNGAVIKAGTKAFGRVAVSSRRGMFGKPGKLDFSCDYLLLSDSTRIPLRATPLSKYGKDNRAATVATAVLLAPVAIFVHGKDVSVKRGTEYTMYVDRDISVSALALAGNVTTPQPPANASPIGAKSVFLMNDNTAVVGVLVSFDGRTYNVTTETGTRSLNAADVKSISIVK